MGKFSSLGSFTEQAAGALSGLLNDAHKLSSTPILQQVTLFSSNFIKEANKQLSDTLLKNRISTRLRSLNTFFANSDVEKKLSQLTNWQPIRDKVKPIVVFYQKNNFNVNLGFDLTQRNPAQVADLNSLETFIGDFVEALHSQLIPNILHTYMLTKEELEAKIDHVDTPHFADWLAAQPVKKPIASLVVQQDAFGNIANDTDFNNALNFLAPPQERISQEAEITEPRVTHPPIIAMPTTSHTTAWPHYLIAGAAFVLGAAVIAAFPPVILPILLSLGLAATIAASTGLGLATLGLFGIGVTSVMTARSTLSAAASNTSGQ